MIAALAEACVLLLALAIAVAFCTRMVMMVGARPMDLPAAHWARDLARRAGLQEVHFYYQHLPLGSQVAAYSTWLPGHNAVIFNARYFFGTTHETLAFIAAHELGHLALGHCRRGFWRSVLLWGMVLQRTAADIQRDEDAADIFAFHLTGIQRPRLA